MSSLWETLGLIGDRFGERHGAVDDCENNETMGLEEILDKLFFIFETIGKPNWHKIVKVFISYRRNIESPLQKHSTVKTLRHLKTKMMTTRLEKNSFKRVELHHKEMKITY